MVFINMMCKTANWCISSSMRIIDTIRKHLEEEMKRQNLSMRALSKAAGMEEGAVKNLFRAQSYNPRIETLMNIANALGCTLDDLCGIGKKQTTDNIDIVSDKERWKDVIEIVDGMIEESKKKIPSKIRAELYLACYEFNKGGFNISEPNNFETVLNFIKT